MPQGKNMKEKELQKLREKWWKKGIGVDIFKKICLDEDGVCLCDECQSKKSNVKK